MTDKILIGNAQAFVAKYGAGGRKKIDKAVKALIKADRARDLNTVYVDISDARTMRRFRGEPVTTSASERQNKQAIDAIYRSATPDYLAILDAPDVIPHIMLDNPIPGDGDRAVPSDLPYASDAEFGSSEIRNYAAVTRVVGRIAGIFRATSPDFLIGQIENATAFKPGRRADHAPYFGISARSWEISTRLSVDRIFGKDVVAICPPTGASHLRNKLAPLSHFINCHGSESDPQFYGQRGKSYPVSLTSDTVAKSVRRNTVVAAECCFGAQLFDPMLSGGKLPIPNAYLKAGAVGFLGSTNVAYGAAIGNGAADLITQFFLINMLGGASLGRACMQARQRFVQSERMADPVNLKTLGQFILLADPSVQPCKVERNEPRAVTQLSDYSEDRKRRRVALAANGLAVADGSAFVTAKKTGISNRVGRRVGEIARHLRFKTTAMRAYQVEPGEIFAKGAISRRLKSKVVVMTERAKRRPKSGPKGVDPTRVLVAHTLNDRFVTCVEYVNR